MPKIYEYLGIVFFFYSNEHEPVHVHARKGEYESKATIIVVEQEIVEVRISRVKGRQPLKGADLSNLKKFLEVYANEVVEKWIDYFVLNKTLDCRKISKKLE